MIQRKKGRSSLRLVTMAFMCLLSALGLLSVAGSALAWIYPEHRDIAMLAVQGLDPERKAVFDRLWQEARAGDEQRLCEQGADTAQGLAPPCIDWAALSGIAGDHSCSSKEMLETVRSSDWILVVADVAAQLKVDLARIPVTAPAGQPGGKDVRRAVASATSRAERLNALRTADTRLQRADPQYALRADSNLAHFMLARTDTNLDPLAYAIVVLKPGSDLNAAGVYAWFHLSALQKAGRLANEQLTPEERRALTRAALLDEAFALHFLEDLYAAGHVAGSWGDVSQRKGTHDFYNQNGLEVFTWKGRDKTIVLMGDAHMRPEDAELASKVVRISIEQVLDTATGRSRGYTLPHDPSAPGQPDAFDICKSVTFPDRGLGLGSGHGTYAAATDEIFYDTPVPGLGPGLGALPRTRSEVGTFIGLAGTLDARVISGGFVPSENSPGLIGGLNVGFRAGLGLEGALGESGDGLVFGQIGFRAETPSTNKAEGSVLGGLSGSLGAAIPSRAGPSARIRMPYYLVPGDLLFLLPMYLINPTAYTQLAITAINGGLIPWQRPWNTSFGRFQFVLGREFGIAWYGITGLDQLAAPSDPPGGLGRVVNYKSVFLDVPLFEYLPYRAFSSNQSSSVMFQLFAGVDVPYGESIDKPQGAPPVNLRTRYSLGLRMLFDWRYYRTSTSAQ
jgi:hypothetical protein